MELRGEKFEVTAFQLKMLAVITMLIDHIGAVILEQSFKMQGAVWHLDLFLRCIGRLAFPLFAFFIVEGFHYTHDRKKYALRLLILALLSEYPFDIAFSGYVDFGYANVIWTLLLGLLTIWTIDVLFRHCHGNILKEILSVVLACVIPVAIELFLLNSDYTIYGIAAIVIMYLLRKHKLIGFAAAVIWLAVIMTPMEAFPMMEAFALLDLIPLYFYHGTQGRKWRPFFYAFYPVHLSVLAFILKVILR